MIFSYKPPERDKLRNAIFNNHLLNEDVYIPQLIDYLDLKKSNQESIKNVAIDLVTNVRKLTPAAVLDSFFKRI